MFRLNSGQKGLNCEQTSRFLLPACGIIGFTSNQDVGVALVISWKRTDVVYVKTLEWIVGGAYEWMRLDEDF
jgi:hypothetical protein